MFGGAHVGDKYHICREFKPCSEKDGAARLMYLVMKSAFCPPLEYSHLERVLSMFKSVRSALCILAVTIYRPSAPAQYRRKDFVSLWRIQYQGLRNLQARQQVEAKALRSTQRRGIPRYNLHAKTNCWLRSPKRAHWDRSQDWHSLLYHRVKNPWKYHWHPSLSRQLINYLTHWYWFHLQCKIPTWSWLRPVSHKGSCLFGTLLCSS